MQSWFDIKVRAMLGPDEHDDKEGTGCWKKREQKHFQAKIRIQGNSPNLSARVKGKGIDTWLVVTRLRSSKCKDLRGNDDSDDNDGDNDDDNDDPDDRA